MNNYMGLMIRHVWICFADVVESFVNKVWLCGWC